MRRDGFAEQTGSATVREWIGLALAISGLFLATLAGSELAFAAGAALWIGLPSYWLAKNIGGNK